MYTRRTIYLLSTTFVSVTFLQISNSYSQPKNIELTSKFNNESLFLTPYIDSGRIQEAQRLATVAPMLNNINSFAGYLTVNKTHNSNLFFWLFKSQQGNWKQRPLVVWLQGASAQASTYGLFREVGPFSVTKDHRLKRRRYPWNRKCNMVFIDNPVGAGYSFTERDSGYPENVFDVARDLYETLIQLHKLFPNFRDNKLIIVGESYGTKYAVAIAHKVHKMNEMAQLKLNLERLVLISGLVDLFSLVKYSSYLFSLGLIDKTQELKFFQQEEEFRADIKTGDFDSALKTFLAEYADIKAVTGFKSAYDFVQDDSGVELKNAATWFLNRTETKTALHVGDHKFNDNEKTLLHMQGDFMRSVKPLIEELLVAECFPILFLNGQLDISAAYSLSLEFFDSLNWPHAKDYYSGKRCQFRVGKQVAAYYKTAGTLTDVLVRNTGHLIAISEPKWSFKLVDRFITNGTYFKCN